MLTKTSEPEIAENPMKKDINVDNYMYVGMSKFKDGTRLTWNPKLNKLFPNNPTYTCTLYVSTYYLHYYKAKAKNCIYVRTCM